jgi:plasmid rolling circle replication initiator protein Rep
MKNYSIVANNKQNNYFSVFIYFLCSLSVQPRDSQNVSTSNNLPESDGNRYAIKI